MKRLLRSVIRWTDADPLAEVTKNYNKLSVSKLNFEHSADKSILAYVQTFYRSHFEAPTLVSVVDYFTAKEDIDALERIKDLETADFYKGSEFDELLDRIRDSQNKQSALALFDTAKTIVTRGVTVDKEEYLGPQDAFRYVTREGSNILIASHGNKTRGSIRTGTDDELERYYTAKYDKSGSAGRLTGLIEMDKIIHGGKPGELHVHAAFTGNLKSTFARSWCYYQAVRAGVNSLYFSLEMPLSQIQTMFAVLHTTHAKWTSQGYTPLAYERVLYGLLTPEEEAFYEMALHDWKTNPDYGDVFFECPDDMDVTIADMKHIAEVRHKESKLGIIVIDHGGLVEPRKKNKDYVIEFNSVVRDAKKVALSFNKGEKIFVLLLAQINRDGYDYAVKNGGRYQLRALGYSNELERSADNVTTSFIDDDHRKNSTCFWDHLKRRDGPLFEPFVARIDYPTQRIYNMDRFGSGEDGSTTYEDNCAVLDLIMGGV